MVDLFLVTDLASLANLLIPETKYIYKSLHTISDIFY